LVGFVLPPLVILILYWVGNRLVLLLLGLLLVDETRSSSLV
jgi:hypothetical protein